MPGSGFWKSKPSLGVQLDRGHPLARGLLGYWAMNEGAGRQVNDLARNNHGTSGSTVSQTVWKGGPSGIAYDIANAGANRILIPDASRLDVPTEFSVVALLMMRTAPLTGNNFIAQLFGDGSSIDTNTMLFRFGDSTSGNARRLALYVHNAGYHGVVAGIDMPLNKWQLVGATHDSVTTRLYMGGVPITSGANAFAAANVALDFVIGATTNNVRPLDGPIAWLGYWGRKLTDKDFTDLNADPYQIFQAPVWRRWFVPGAGGDATMVAQLVTATAIAPNAALNAGSVLAAQAATATVVSPEVALQVNVAMAAQAAAATVAAPNAEIQASSILAAQPSTASVVSPNSAITGGALLASQASMATATSPEVAFLAGGNVVLSAQAALATVAAPNAAIQAGSVLGASLATATAESPAAVFQVKGELLAQLGTADVVVHSGIFSSGVAIIAQPALMTAISPSIAFLAGVQILAQIVTVTAISPEAILVGLGAAEPMHVTGILDVDATVSGNLDADSRIGGTLDTDSTLGGTLGS